MGRVETNIFTITNLSDLSTEYRLFRIRGLRPEQDEYYQNLNHITRKLSYELRAPVTTIQRGEEIFLVVPIDTMEPQSPFPLVRSAPVIFEPCSEVYNLDYTLRSPENDAICLRFLQFLIQAPLHNHPELWQPGAGGAFFRKNPSEQTTSISRYFGFTLRSVLTPDGGLGLCVDVTSKTVSSIPLPVKIDRNTFSGWKGKHCIYHYGYRWYEIRIDALSDLNASTYLISKGARFVSLLDYITEETNKPLPKDMTTIPYDAAVVLYHDHRDNEKAAPAPLCYPVLGSDDETAGSQHQKTILEPYKRRSLTLEFVQRYLKCLRFGNAELQVAHAPVTIPRRMFVVPDLEFGQKKILSVKATSGAEHISLDRLGNARLDLLLDKDAGFYSRDPLDRQYLILPQSIYDSCGRQFICDLKRAVNQLFPQDHGYDPIVVTYNDRGPKTSAHQSKAIWDVVQAQCNKPGYAVVMIHETVDRKIREEDQLAAFVLQKMRRLDIFAAIIHSRVAQDSYELIAGKNGESSYAPRRNRQGKLHGYLRNVALNKVLLTNQRWPFVLAESLHADITIGIDVKNHTAGLVIVGNNGGEIRSLLKTSRYKEQLYGNQLETLLIEILKKEIGVGTRAQKTIVIHRDGRTYPSEIEQAKRAFASLKQNGVLESDATLTILEIPKTSPVPFRLYEVSERDGQRDRIDNPQIGYYHIVTDTEGYICSTGRAFAQHPGTVQPLHARKAYGPLPLEMCLEDLYRLTTLTWTRPEDCARYPITIKLNDRFLLEDASEYDEENLDQLSDSREEASE